MADIATTTFGIGDPVPPFSLPDTDGVAHAVPQADPAPSATVLVVSCCHCPYVIAWNPRLRRVAEEYGERGVRFLAIHANDASRYPADSLDAMRRFVREQQWPIPYLHDEAQDVARALGAEVTPHVFVLDGEHRLVYRGAPDADHRDDSRDAEWLRAAIDAVLAGEAPREAETRARGCSVKWRG
jgi:peroxiredoxin